MDAKAIAAGYRRKATAFRASAEKLDRMAEELESDELAHLVFSEGPPPRRGGRKRAIDTPKSAAKKNRRGAKGRRPTSPRRTTRRGGRPTRQLRDGSTGARVAASVAAHPHQSRSERAAALAISQTLLSYHLRKQGLASQAD